MVDTLVSGTRVRKDVQVQVLFRGKFFFQIKQEVNFVNAEIDTKIA